MGEGINKMKITMERITPLLARQWLEKNTVNRPLRHALVCSYANEMARGRWHLTNQGIAFFEDGALADGQHRLHAIVLSGASVDMQVTRGMMREAMVGVDGGGKRTAADHLHLHYGITNANAFAACARQIISIFFSYQGYSVSAEVLHPVIKHYEADMLKVVPAVAGFRPATKAWVHACLVIARHRHPERIDSFLDGFATGEGLKAGHPAHTVREWLIQGTSQHLKGSYKRAAVESVLNALYHQVRGSTYKVMEQGAQGYGYFVPQEKRLVDSIRVEIAHLLRR
jgi:hypothetical protein